MRISLLALGVALVAGAVHAGAPTTTVNSAAAIRFTASESFSCQIFRRRMDDLAKGRAGLHGLLDKIKQRKEWSALDLKRVSSMIAKIQFVPGEYSLSSIQVALDWPVDESWSQVLSSSASLQVRWQFKGMDWRDERGIMPDEVTTLWSAEKKEIHLSTLLSPMQLCYGPTALVLTLSETGKSDPSLTLLSRVDWP